MGFFDTLGKLINGQPVFDAQSPPPPTHANEPTGAGSVDPTRTQSGHKVLPELRIARVKSSRSGDKMTSYAWVQNESPFEIEVTRCTVLGQSQPMNYRLGVGQGREVKVYEGSVGRQEHGDAHIDYKISSNGDYFQQEFHVELDRQSDGAYLLEEFHRDEHVRDT